MGVGGCLREIYTFQLRQGGGEEGKEVKNIGMVQTKPFQRALWRAFTRAPAVYENQEGRSVFF